MTGLKSQAILSSLRAIEQAVGQVRVTGSQNRHGDEESPSWMLHIEGTNEGVRYTVETEGPILIQATNDAIAILQSLGIDVFADFRKVLDEQENP